MQYTKIEAFLQDEFLEIRPSTNKRSITTSPSLIHLAKCMTYPLDLLKHRMASTGKSNLVETASALYDKEGAPGFYSGLQAKLYKSVTGKALYYYIYSGFQRKYEPQTIGMNLLLAGLAETAVIPVIAPIESVVR